MEDWHRGIAEILRMDISPAKNPSKVPDDRYLRGLSPKINGLRWSDPF